jgi:hypothetical protein
MSKNDDELNEFIDEVTDGAYRLPCVEVIFKFGIRIRMYAHTFYDILFRIPFNSILWSSLTHSDV